MWGANRSWIYRSMLRPNFVWTTLSWCSSTSLPWRILSIRPFPSKTSPKQAQRLARQELWHIPHYHSPPLSSTSKTSWDAKLSTVHSRGIHSKNTSFAWTSTTCSPWLASKDIILEGYLQRSERWSGGNSIFDDGGTLTFNPFSGSTRTSGKGADIIASPRYPPGPFKGQICSSPNVWRSAKAWMAYCSLPTLRGDLLHSRCP